MSEFLTSLAQAPGSLTGATPLLKSRFGTTAPQSPLAVSPPNDQFTRQAANPSGQQSTLTPAMLAALSPPPQTQAPSPAGTTDPRTAAIALMLIQQQQKLKAPASQVTGLPRPAAATLQGSPVATGPNGLPVPQEPDKPPFSLKTILIAGAAALGLAKGTEMAMNVYDGSHWWTGEAMPEKQVSSALAKTTQFLDNGPGVSSVSNAIDNHWGPEAKGNASVKQMLGALHPDELDKKLLGGQFDEFNKAMSSKEYPDTFRTFIADKQLDTVLKRPITEFPAWAKEGLLRKQVLSAPAELGDEVLTSLFNKVMHALPDDAPPPANWHFQADELATKIRNPQGKSEIANFIQTQLHEPTGKMTAVLDSLHDDPKMMSWMDEHLATTMVKSPNNARQMALEVFGDLAQKELGSAEHFLKLQDEIHVLKGGWTRPFNAVPFNNAIRNLVGKVFRKPSEADTVQDLAKRALEAFGKYPEQTAKFSPDVVKALQDTADGAASSLKLTTRQELLDYLGKLERGISTEVKQAKSLTGHIKGFISRVGRQMGVVGQPYRNTYQTMEVLGSKALFQQAKAASIFKDIGEVAEAVKSDILKAMADTPDALKSAVKGANLGDDALEALLKAQADSDKVGALKGLSRGFVGFYQTLKGIFNGKLFEEALSSSANIAGDAAAKGFLNKAKSVGGKLIGPLAVFIGPVFETLDADNTPSEKVKTFLRGFLGAGIGWALGWSAMHNVIAGFGLDKMSLGRNLHKPVVNLFGHVITRGGFVAEIVAAFVVGNAVDKLGRKVSDVLFGKPLHVQRTEAKAKLEKAQKEQTNQLRKQQVEQMRRQAQGAAPTIGPNGLPYLAAAPLQRPQQQSPVGLPSLPSPVASPLPSDRLPLAAAHSLSSPNGLSSPSTTNGSVITGARKPGISALHPSDIASPGDRTSWRGLNEAQ